MYDIVTYSTNDGYTGRFTNKDPRPDFYITYDTKWIDIAVELEAPIDITTLRGWTLNDEFFFGYDLGPGVENSQGIVTRKKLYTSQIKARLFIREDELTEHRRIDVCISTVVCRDLERLRVGEWIFFDNPDICFTLYLTELAPEVPESADSIGPDPIIDICPQIFACYGNIDSADINDLRVGPNIELDSDGIKAQDSDEGPSVKVDPSGVESKNPDPDNNKESKQSPEGLKAKDNNSGNEANYGADGMGFGSPGPGGGAGGSSGGLGSGAGPGGGPGLGLDGPGGSAALGPEGLGFGPPGAGGEGFASFGPEGMGTPPYKFSKDGIEYPEEGASIKFNPDAETPGWEFNPPLPVAEVSPTAGGGGAGEISGLPSGQPGQMLSYRPPLDSSRINPLDPSKLPRFADDLPTGHFMDYPLKPGRFIWGEEALEEEKENIPASQFPKMTPEKKEELFNSWPGFSQSPTAGNETNPEFPTSGEPYPPAGTQPFSPADAAAWGYDPTSDTLKNDNPTDTFSGKTSPKGYDEYELEATLSSDTPTDGPIAVVAAEVKDPITGKTNNISAVRRPKTLVVTEEMDENNEAPYETPSWGLVYNYGQPDEKWFETDNSITAAAPASTEPGFPGASHDDWVNAGPTRVRVVKEPDGIYVETSQFGSENLDPDTGQYIAFESEPELEQFNNKKTGFGFGSKDQPAKVSDIKFETSDPDNHIVDVKNNQIYAYVPDNPDDLAQAGVESSGYYNLDSSFGVDDVFGDGRLLFNDRTKELFWSDPENKFQLARPYQEPDQRLYLGNPIMEFQGTGANNNQDAYLRLNGEKNVDPVDSNLAGYENQTPGLRLTTFDSSGEFIGGQTYNTNEDPAASDNLATAINNMNKGDIGVLTSQDAYEGEITPSLKDTAFANGLYKLYNTKTDGVQNTPYASIFQKTQPQITPDGKTLKPAKSFETTDQNTAGDLPARIKAGITNGTFYTYGPEKPNALVSFDQAPYAWIDSNKDLWAENGIMADGGRMRSQLVAAFGWGEGIGWDEDRILAVAEDSIDSSNSLVWDYLSHDSTNTYPARSTDDASAWTISPSGNTIGLELRNNLSFVGLTQEDETTTYSTAATLSSTDSSPVAIGLIIAAVEDGGREYTLSAMRSMGIVDPLSGYGIYYNYNQSDERLISSKNIAAVNPLKWSGNGPVRLQYSKNPSEVKVITSQNNSVIIDSSTEININLTDDPDLIKFTTATKGGFGGLREFVSRTYQNGAFDDPSYTVSGSTVSLSGWTVQLEQTRLGIDAIGGITSPSDPTPNPPGGGGRLSPGDAELHPSMSYYWQYLTKDATIGGVPLGKNCVRMYSSGTVETGGAIAHGPHLISNDYLTIPSGTNIGFSWRAAAGGDAYDVLAYLLRDDGYTEILLNTTQEGASGDTGWLRVDATVNQTGNYKFVFVSGTFDYTFGRAAGASLFVTEVDVEFPAASGPIQVTFSDIQHAKEKVVPAPLDEDSNANGVRIHVKEDLKSGGVGHHLYIENDNFCDLDEITIISGKINLISCKDDGQIYIDGNKVIHKGNLESSLSQIPALAPVLNPTSAEEIENPFTVITAPTIGGNNQLIYDSASNTLQFEPLQSTDEIPEGENNIFFTDSRVFNYLTTNNYYTESAVNNYLVTNNYYTESAVNNYLITNNYYTESAVNNYLITNNYYTESDVTNYVDTAVLEYTLDAAGESGGVKLSLLADGSSISDIHFTGGPNILISYVPDFYKPEQIYFEAIGLDYRLRGTEVTDGVKFTLLRDDEFATDSFQIIGEGLIDVSWDSNQKIVSLSVDSADIISLINQYGSGLDSGEVITLIEGYNYLDSGNVINIIEGYNYLDSGNVINIIESYNILDSADVIAISGTPISYLEDLLDVSNAPGDSGDYLKWNGTEWEPSRGDSYQLLSNSPGYNSAKIYLNQLSEGGAYPNSTFSDTTQTVSGNQVTMNGWIAIRSQVRLGIDAIGGFTTPTDPTPNPVGQGGQVSPGDGTLDPSMNFYSEFTTLGGKDCIRLYSSGNVSTFGDVSHGPYLISQDYSYFAQGSTVAFSWRAAAGGDAYDVFAYLLKDDGTYQILLNETQGGTSGDTGWLTVSETVAQSGNYKFVFVSGTFDYSFGGVAGASLYVTDVKTEIGTEAGGVNINGGTGILVTHTAPNTITITNTGSGSGSGGLDSASINDLGDVNTSGATTGDVLEFDGTNWVPGTGGALYTAGDGIVLSSFSFSVDTTVLRTNASQTITAGKKFNDGIILQFGTGGDMDMYHNATNNIIDLRNGDLLIREYTTVGTTKFTFGRSTGDFTAAGDITAFSDERLKSDIKTLDNSLEKVKLLRGVSYTKDGKPGIGLIAQEVEKVLPEVVHQSDEFKAVAYGNIIGVLIEAVKELSSRVEELERDR
jgi:5-hydroxyisourate hydrolase-like protein (transthyretin family)